MIVEYIINNIDRCVRTLVIEPQVQNIVYNSGGVKSGKQSVFLEYITQTSGKDQFCVSVCMHAYMCVYIQFYFTVFSLYTNYIFEEYETELDDTVRIF